MVTRSRPWQPGEGNPPGGPTWRSWREAAGLVLRGATVSVAAPVSGVVGTLLSAVNQGDVLLAGDASAATVIKVGVNYVVPFTVASIGFLGARRAPLDGGPGREGVADTGRQDPPP